MANEVQTTSWAQESGKFSDVLSKIKWFFKKDQPKSWDVGSARLTKSFHLTRKDSIVSVVVAIIVLCWAIYYWSVVWNEYESINDRSDELKNLSTYNIRPNSDKLYQYSEWGRMDTVNEMISINNNVEAELIQDEIFKQQQKWYYEVLLQNIYLPSINIWKDPYTKNFDMWVLWQEYLESDKYQDLYLIQYWSDFVKYVWNDADYNKVDSITLWEKTVLEWNPDYFYIPITVSFSSPNKRSFLLLVNKLSMTSNQNNIALLNEFFFYLLNNIKKNKEKVIDQLMQDYRDEFSSSSNWDLATTILELTDAQKDIYKDRVIWYNLYHRIKWDSMDKNNANLIDDDIIIKTIKESATCTEDDEKCFYNFRDKYRNLPYLAYKIWLQNQNNRTKLLLEFLQDLPPAIAITSFGFEKYSDSSFLNNKEEEYQWKVTFNAYWRNISDAELEEASLMLWKLCFWISDNQKTISPKQALESVEESIISLWWTRDYSSASTWNVSALWELQWLFTLIDSSYDGLTNYDKMIKLFEIRRMMNDGNLCSNKL